MAALCYSYISFLSNNIALSTKLVDLFFCLHILILLKDTRLNGLSKTKDQRWAKDNWSTAQLQGKFHHSYNIFPAIQ